MLRPEDNIQASVLDRLIGKDLSTSGRNIFREVKACVMRDIENLLNTKKSIIYVPGGYVNLEKSVFTYGVKDFTHESAESISSVPKLLKEIKRTIEIFEPRLKRVRVALAKDVSGGQINFEISGVLVVDPISEPVSFDTHLESKSGKYVVEK